MARHELYDEVPAEDTPRGVTCIYCASEVLQTPPCVCPGCGRALELVPDTMTVGLLRARMRHNGYALRLAASVASKTRALMVDLSFPDDATLGEVAKAAAEQGLALELASTPLPEPKSAPKSRRKR